MCQDAGMTVPWKLVVVGGEVTVLAAFTGVGIHLAMQPHRLPSLPSPMVLPSDSPGVLPTPGTLLAPVPSSLPARARPSEPALPVDLADRLGREDRHQLDVQWQILERLIKAVEQYLEHRVIPDMERRR
jgi:hypothetical protein